MKNKKKKIEEKKIPKYMKQLRIKKGKNENKNERKNRTKTKRIN